MQMTYAPGSSQSVGIFQHPWFASAEAVQTISPSSLVIVTSGTQTFTTNLPAIWTVVHGSLVVAPDGLSAVYTAPGSAGADTVTVTNEDDPGNVASAPIIVSSFGPPTLDDTVDVMAGVHAIFAGRSVVDVGRS